LAEEISAKIGDLVDDAASLVAAAVADPDAAACPGDRAGRDPSRQESMISKLVVAAFGSLRAFAGHHRPHCRRSR
jgi:hypothetical protein